jgi:hypothetical protein
MPKEMTLELIRNKLHAKSSEIKEEYERRIEKLEAKIEQLRKERDTRLVKADKRFRKDSCVWFTRVVGQQDYRWLSEWLMKNKEKEIKEAGEKHETGHVNELKEMSAEDYLFYYLNNPEIERRLKKEMEQNKSEEAKRLSFILAKLKLENLRLQRTRI